MIETIKRETRLAGCLKKDYENQWLEDEGIRVEIDASLQETEYASVKVDDYYNGLNIANPPKSVDFLVAVDCRCDWYALYILELRNRKKAKYLDIPAIHKKFSNTFRLFMEGAFPAIFCNDRFKYKPIKLYLVSDPYGIKEKYPEIQHYAEYRQIIRKRMARKDTAALDVSASLASKLYRFRGQILKIELEIPPNPLIRRIT